jgi:hypothetical protein
MKPGEGLAQVLSNDGKLGEGKLIPLIDNSPPIFLIWNHALFGTSPRPLFVHSFIRRNRERIPTSDMEGGGPTMDG